jgi:phosphopantothenoylcysteine decarboxylase/phosphopantothenate--cysteine ligase
MLKGKNVLLGVTAGIAAYKTAFICRELIKKEAKVKVLMTPHAADFITPLTLSTLSRNPVGIHYFNPENGEWNNHVELAKWADVMLIAPLTLNTLSKMAHGICDNLLLATYFSMDNPVYVAPAMDLDMYQHAATKEALALLQKQGVQIIPAGTGELASGLSGEGRMAEIEEIVNSLENNFGNGFWKGKKVLITAGPTEEAIDPVRYISNHSTGKMGFALTRQLHRMGAIVTLIHGPVNLPLPAAHKVKQASTAREMFEAVSSQYEDQDVLIMSAAVSDYQVKEAATEKIKKKGENFSLELTPTQDILKFLGENKKKEQVLVGFALETEQELQNAQKKLQNKKADMIVLNSLKNEGAGFGHETNKVSMLLKNGKQFDYPLKSKMEVAVDIINCIEKECF